MEFYRNKNKSARLLIYCSIVFILLLPMFYYCSGLMSGVIVPKGIVISSLGILFLGIYIVKGIINFNNNKPLIVFKPEGIIASVTPVSYAAGLISWDDVVDVGLTHMSGDTLVTLYLKNPEKYKPLIRKKLSRIALSGLTDPRGLLKVNMTASELHMNAQELLEETLTYKTQLKHPVFQPE